MTNQTSNSVSLDLLALHALHPRIRKGFAYLHTHRGNGIYFERGKERLVGLLTREYLPLLTTLLATHDRAEIEAQRAHVEGRLERGSDLLNTATSERVTDAYIELIEEYEILSDALQVGQHPDTFLRRAFDRMDAIRNAGQVAA